jgi:excisionase family DNA binding protein
MIDIEQLWKVLEPRVRQVVREELDRDTAPEQVTVAEYAKARSISPRTVCTAIKAGRLPAIKVGRQYRIARTAELGNPAEVRPRAESLEQRALKLLRGGGR